MATADKTGYRKYLNEKGIKDDDITYDNGAVNVKGRLFDFATPEEDGSTYNTRSNLEKAYNKYRGDTLYEQYANRVLEKPKPIVKPQPYQFDMQKLYSNPGYQTGMQAAQQGAATQQGNTLARLRAMGQGKSSYSEGVANQIGQQAVADFNTKFIPQVMADDYRKYLDNIDIDMKIDDANFKREADYSNALKGVAGDYYGLYNDELKRESDARATNIKNAADLSEKFGIGVLPKESGEALFEQVAGRPTVKAQTEQRQYFQELVNASDKYGEVLPELAQMIGVPAGTPMLNAVKEINDAAYQFGMLGVSRQNAATSARQADISAKNANTSAARLDFDKEQANKPKEQKASTNAYKTNPDFATDYQFVKTNPEKAKQSLQTNAADFINEYGFDGYMDLLKGLPKEDQDETMKLLESILGG